MESRSSRRGRASAWWLAGLSAVMAAGTAAAQPCDGQWQTGNGLPGISGDGSGVMMSWDPDGAGSTPELLYVGGTYKLAHTTLVKSLASWEPLFNAQNPAGIWRDVAGGLTKQGGALGSAFTMLPIGTDMLIGGSFTTAGATAATNVVKLDGLTNTWVPYGTGVPGPVFGSTVFNGVIYICGTFRFTASNKTGDSVARWDGVRWQVVGQAANGGLQNPDPMNPLPATIPGNVYCLAVYNNALYAGGDFAYSGLDNAMPPMPIECHHMARYNPQTQRWSQVIPTLTAPFPYTPAIYTMRVFGNLLYCGGVWDNVGNSFCAFDGLNFIPVNGGVFKAFGVSQVFSQTQVGQELIVGGDFEFAGVQLPATSNNLVRWTGARYFPVADGGTSGPVYSVANHRGQVAAMGDFGIVAGQRVRGTVWYDGGQWRRMGFNCDAPIYAMKPFNNQLVVAGSFGRTPGDVQASGIASFNGTSWAQIGPGLQLGGSLGLPNIYNLSEHLGQLVAMGEFDRSGAVSNLANVATWDGARWNPLGQVDGPVYGGASYRGQWFIAGDLVNYGNIAQYDGIGGYNAVTFGTDGPGLAMSVFQDRLVAGGAFTVAGGVGTGPIANWNYDTETWAAYSNQVFTPPPADPPILPQVNVIAVIDGDLYIGGNWINIGGAAAMKKFVKYNTVTRQWTAVGGAGGPDFDVWSIHKVGSSIYVGGAGGANIKAYDGTAWRTVDGGTDGAVFALGDLNDRLYAGGNFLTASGQPSAYFSSYIPDTAVTITAPPASVTTCEGGTVSLSVTASGTGPYTYQWKKNGTNINGAVAQTYNISPATPGDAGNYTCVVSNLCSSATSAAAAVVVNTAATITTQPVDRTLCEGSALNLSVAATGTAPITFQWRRNNTDIPGATSATYTVASATAANSGTYSCIVTNPCAVRTSNPAVVVVNVGAQITSQPETRTLCTGAPLLLSVAASGSAPITYQWRRNNANIEGATSSVYNVGAVSAADAGSYTCVVSNSCNTQTSNPGVVTVNETTAITGQPAGGATCSGGSFTFTVTAAGSGLTYQWQRNNSNINGATSASYTINPVNEGSAGTYRVIVTGACGTVTSDGAALTIGGEGATITSQPQGADVCRGAEVSLSVTATGAGLTYQWQRNGEDIPEANGTTYTIGSVNLATAGTYRVQITSACGVLTSDPAVVSYCGADFNCDEFVDFFDYLDFVDAYTGGLPGGDFNGDEFIDFFDYLDFTDAFTAGC